MRRFFSKKEECCASKYDGETEQHLKLSGLISAIENVNIHGKLEESQAQEMHNAAKEKGVHIFMEKVQDMDQDCFELIRQMDFSQRFLLEFYGLMRTSCHPGSNHHQNHQVFPGNVILQYYQKAEKDGSGSKAVPSSGPAGCLACTASDLCKIDKDSLVKFEEEVALLSQIKHGVANQQSAGDVPINHFLSNFIGNPQNPVDWELGIKIVGGTSSGNSKTGGISNNMNQMAFATPIPVLKKASSIMARRFGHDRFLRLRISSRGASPKQVQDMREVLLEKGILSGWRLYKFWGAKDDQAIFWAERSFGLERQDFGRSLPLSCFGAMEDPTTFSPLSAARARSWLLGPLTQSSDSVQAPHQIELIDDIFSPQGKCMTDGSGFISSDLAELLPFRVFQGVTYQQHFDEEPTKTQKQYAVVQVRIFCHMGVFKGTLLISPHIQNKIQLRANSMKKCEAPIRFSSTILGEDYPCNPDYLQNVKWAAVSSQLSNTIDQVPTLEVVSTANIPKNSCVKLNPNLILILSSLGVPNIVFEEIFWQEAWKIQNMTDRADIAIEMLERDVQDNGPSSSGGGGGGGGARAAAGEAEGGGRRRGPLWGEPDRTALLMLRAGQPLQDPFVAGRLRRARRRAALALRRLRPARALPRAAWLAGQPDPTGALRPGEVFVAHGIPNTVNKTYDQVHEGFYVGKVAVTRYPLMEPSAVRVLSAVFCNELVNFLGNRTGVIFFSTQGNRPEVEYMAAGDYDGDLYWVCYNQSVLVHMNQKCSDSSLRSDLPTDGGSDKSSIGFSDQGDLALNEPSAPSLQKLESTPGTKEKLCKIDIEASEMMNGSLLGAFLADLRNHVVGRSANLWVTWADRLGPTSWQCRQLAGIHCASLASLKHGGTRHIPAFLEVDEYPHYLNVTSMPSFRSESICGRLYEIARTVSLLENEASRQRSSQGAKPLIRTFLQLDVDMQTSGAVTYLYFCQTVLKGLKEGIIGILQQTKFLHPEHRNRGRSEEILKLFCAVWEETVLPYCHLEINNDQNESSHHQQSKQGRLGASTDHIFGKFLDLASAFYESIYADAVGTNGTGRGYGVAVVQSFCIDFLWGSFAYFLNCLKQRKAIRRKEKELTAVVLNGISVVVKSPCRKN